MSTRSVVPEILRESLRLRRVRHHFRQADYVNSSNVALQARLDVGVGIARDVVINSGVSIGRWTYVNKGSIIFSGTIGNYCSIGHYVLIGGENHPLNHLSTSPRFRNGADYEEISSAPEIGSDVWIAAGATILQGVRIGHGAVIAAGSIVTHDVPAYSVVAGAPAREVKKRFDDSTIQRLLSESWWSLDGTDLVRFERAAATGDRWQETLYGRGDRAAHLEG